MKTLSIIILLVATIVICQKPPFWGGNPQYRVRVSLTNPEPIAFWDFDYFYDATLKAERYQHYPPQFDETCLIASPPFDENHQCNIIFATDGWTYVQYPNENWCCKCQNSFGGVRYDWLQKDSHFQGLEVVDGDQKVQHWTKWGQYLNHYYCFEDQRPYRFNELWGPQKILKQWDFKLETYVVGPFDRSLIDPPQNCQNLCGGECANMRKQDELEE